MELLGCEWERVGTILCVMVLEDSSGLGHTPLFTAKDCRIEYTIQLN